LQSGYIYSEFFKIACSNNLKNVADLLLNTGFDPNNKAVDYESGNNRPIDIATEAGNFEILKMVLDKLARHKGDPLHHPAIYSGSEKHLKCLSIVLNKRWGTECYNVNSIVSCT